MFEELKVRRQLNRHRAHNTALERVFRHKRVDFDLPRSIDLFFWAKKEAAARKLASALSERGYAGAACSQSTDGGSKWSVQAKAPLTIRGALDAQFTEGLVRLAVSCSAEFDGWGTFT